MTQENQPASFIEKAARNRETVSYGLIAAGVVMLVITIFWAIRWHSGRDKAPAQADNIEIGQLEDTQPKDGAVTNRSDYFPAAIWSGLVSALLVIAGCIFVSHKPVPGKEVYETRVLLMSAGGGVGLLTALLGFAFAWRWQDDLVRWVNLGATGGAKWVVAALAIFLAGLVLMFFSVQLARAEERNNVLLRRILYGSNAVLSGLLLLLLLSVVNMIVFLKLPENMISTASAFKGLSDPSKEFVKEIADDVTVYVIMPENVSIPITRSKNYNGLYADCRALLSACQMENRRIKVVPMSPALNGEEIANTMKRLKVAEENANQQGLLISYGKNEELTAFIRLGDLFSRTQDGAIAFQGENLLLNELNFLSGGGQKPVVYFTQSNLEPSIAEGPKEEATLRTARILVDSLKERKYEIRPLRLEPGVKTDITDAAIIVIAAPRKPFLPEQVEFFSSYLKAGGRIVAFLPVFPDGSKGGISATGLETLFDDFGIHVEANRQILGIPIPQRDYAGNYIFGTSASQARRDGHALANVFRPGEALVFGNVRPVSAVALPKANRGFTMNAFATIPQWETYQDDRFNSDPASIAEQIRVERERNGNQTALEKKLTKAPVPFAAYAGEMVQDGDTMRERPRLLVIGTDWFILDDAVLKTPSPGVYAMQMGRVFDWMREKPKGMLIEPKALGTYSLPKDPDGVALLVLPISLLSLGILGLGVGVWVARRR